MKFMKCKIVVLGIHIALFSGVATAQSGGLGPFNNSSYAAISSKVAQAQGDPANITVNLFLGWTGAWDSVVMKQANLLEQWLPKGSKVEWKRNLQGPPVVTDLLANKQNIAYLGDNPAIVSTTKTSIAPLKIVGFNLISMGRMCGVLLVRSDAPKFNSPEEVFKWLQDKKVAVPKGSCADRTGQEIMRRAGISVDWQYNQAEVIVTSLEAKKIDAAVVYEPSASNAVENGFGRFALSGAHYKLLDADAIIMRQDFIEKNRGAAVAWLKANIQALYFMKEKPIETVNLIKKEIPELTRENIWQAFYGQMPPDTGALPVVNNAVMSIIPASRELSTNVFAFLKGLNVVQGELSSDAIDPSLVVQAFKELGLDPDRALFELRGGLPKDNPFRKNELKKI